MAPVDAPDEPAAAARAKATAAGVRALTGHLVRPRAVAHRTGLRQRKGDFVLLQQRFRKASGISPVERVGHSAVILENTGSRSGPVMRKIVTAEAPLPFAARRPMTFDRSSGWVTSPHLQSETGTRSRLRVPQSLRQRGAVENTARRAPRCLPREAGIRQMTEVDIREIADRMNATPRKCLGRKTSAKSYTGKIWRRKVVSAVIWADLSRIPRSARVGMRGIGSRLLMAANGPGNRCSQRTGANMGNEALVAARKSIGAGP